MIGSINSKIKNSQSLPPLLAQWRFKSYQIVFTNGCFDLIHLGHLHYLAEAKSLGDKLIVGVNSDASVQRLKGQHRPIKNQQTRLNLLAALQFVDAVILFEQDTPYELIKIVQPNILVKGGDWQPHQIVGSDIVLQSGGEVRSLQFIPGYSTSRYEQKIKES